MAHRRGFTLIEAGFSIVAISALCGFGMLQPEKKPSAGGNFLNPLSKARASARQIKDSTHIRGIHQGLVLFAQNNKDSFPLPSAIDVKNDTVDAPAAEKDTTSHIMSILIFNGFFGPELCVSPGHTSYAHLMPSKPRYPLWTSTFDATQPVLGNRGPKVAAVTYKGEPGARTATPEIHGKSKTFAIHATPDAWEGNIAFADGHVEFMTQLTHAKRTFKNDKDEALPDVLFLNEDTDPADTNIILGIFTHAGPTTRNFKAIWD
jgi:prepilin-type processing-associated H-X9-DG protein